MSSSKWGDPLSWRENHVAKPAFGFLAIGNSATSTFCFVISVNRLTTKPRTNLVLRAQLQMDFRRAAAPPRSRRGLSPPSQPKKAAAVRPEPRVLCASHSRLAACAYAGPAALRSGAERTSGSPVPASPVPRRRDARGTGIGKYRLRFLPPASSSPVGASKRPLVTSPAASATKPHWPSLSPGASCTAAGLPEAAPLSRPSLFKLHKSFRRTTPCKRGSLYAGNSGPRFEVRCEEFVLIFRACWHERLRCCHQLVAKF